MRFRYEEAVGAFPWRDLHSFEYPASFGISFHQLVVNGVTNEFRIAFHIHFFEYAGAIRADRLFAQIQFVRDHLKHRDEVYCWIFSCFFLVW